MQTRGREVAGEGDDDDMTALNAFGKEKFDEVEVFEYGKTFEVVTSSIPTGEF